MSSNGYMFDTNIINRFVDNQIAPADYSGKVVVLTHIQHDEVLRTKAPFRLAQLETMIASLEAATVPTSSFVWDDTKWGQGRWSERTPLHVQMLKRLQELDKKQRKRSRQPLNQSRDVRIAETAIKEGLTLVSTDGNLRTVTIEAGGLAIDLPEFLDLC